MRRDVLLDAEANLQIANGDFVVGNSDSQHVYLIVSSEPGWWKQFPTTGVGRRRMLNGPLDGALRRELQLQLESDKYRVKQIRMDTKRGIEIDYA